MRRPFPRCRRQEGVAAIELALIMLFFMGLLPIVLMFGRAFFAYTAMQKGAHDAARYLATLPLPQMMKSATAVQGTVFGQQMVLDAMAETWPGMQAVSVTVDCLYADGFYKCGASPNKPLQVRVTIIRDIPITFLPVLMQSWLPQMASIPLRANAALRYDN